MTFVTRPMRSDPAAKLYAQTACLWQTAATMLIEMWERLRGFDKWVEAEARIVSSEVQETLHTNQMGRTTRYYASGNVLTWMDQSAKEQSASFKMPDSSRLYQMVDGQSLRIRYNPKNPAEFYLRELFQSQLFTGVKTVLLVLIVLMGLTYRFWMPVLLRQ
jgi:hypothetical protein